MKKKLVSLILSAVVFSTVFSVVQPLAEVENKTIAFPGAEGGGRFASGGRGGEIYIVDTLEDYLPGVESPIKGSLRDAVSKDNRTVIFHVSGVIELKDTLRITNKKNLTIAGQTAPGDGITIYGYDTDVSNSENLIIRYIRFRAGSENVHSGDSLDAIWGRCMKDVMVDHVSTSWSTDETMSLYRAENMTVQWSIISESMTMSGHTKGRHGYGAIWGGSNTTYHHNLIAHHTSRAPRMGGGTREADDNDHLGLFDMRNNVIYNWGFNSCYGGGRAEQNFVYNYMKPGPGTRESVKTRLIDCGEKDKPGGFYVAGNYLEGYPEITEDNSLGIYISDAAAPTTEIVDEEFKMEGTEAESLKTETPEEAYEKVLKRAGATYPRRDAHDARIVTEVEEGLGKFANRDEEIGGFPYTTAEKRPDDFDKNRNGVPDEWELANKLEINNPNDINKLASDGSGYTMLEKYLNSLVDMEYEPENPKVTVIQPENNQIYRTGDVVTVEADVTDDDGIEIVEFYLSDKKIGERKEKPYSIEIDNLVDGTYFVNVKATDKEGNQTQATMTTVHVNDYTPSISWQSKDIGNTLVQGNTAVYENEDSIVVKGSGKLSEADDSFHFAYMPIIGDCEISVKVDSMTPVDHHAFAGVMIRETLKTDSKAVTLGISQTKAYQWDEYNSVKKKKETLYRNPFSIYLAGRYETGGKFDELGENLDSMEAAEESKVILQNDIPFKVLDKECGYYLKLKRRGNLFTAYISENGKEWQELGSRTVDMSEKVYVGLAVDSNQVKNDINNLNTVKYSNVFLEGSTTALNKMTKN